MNEAAIGSVTVHFYSADHGSQMNKAYVEAFEKANHLRSKNYESASLSFAHIGLRTDCDKS